MTTTPSGRFLGRKPDKADPRDRRFAEIHRAALSMPLPPSIDLGGRPAYDQGKIGSCGPNSMDRLMCHLYPEQAEVGFSRLHIYAGVRDMEGDFSTDGGVETRDLFKFVAQAGAILESSWPYDLHRLYDHPPPVQPTFPILSYSRLVGDNDMLSCLASGHKFVIGVDLFQSFDGNELARTGVMAMPDPKRESVIGGHDMCVDGFDINFKQSKTFKDSGVNSDLMPDAALLVCNSWGPAWGLEGRLWMPLPYASNPSTGGDAWTGRRFADTPQSFATLPRRPSIDQLNAAFYAARDLADHSKYSGFITDEMCRSFATVIANAVVETGERP
jgi:C1A family cysteine protease